MRINGLPIPAYPLERPARPGSAVTPYGESRQAAQRLREVEAGTSRNDSQRPARESSRSEPVALAGELYRPIRYEAAAERPLSSRAAQALASYNLTASFAVDPDAAEVLGLDLYA